MMVIITGENRVEICIPNRKQEGLHFFKTRGQLYRIFPNCLSRARIFDYGMEVGSEECIIYRENDIVPYDTMDFDYSMDRLLSDVDRHKLMNPTKLGSSKLWFTNVKTIWDWIFSKVGISGLVIGAVVLYAFVAPMLGVS